MIDEVYHERYFAATPTLTEGIYLWEDCSKLQNRMN